MQDNEKNSLPQVLVHLLCRKLSGSSEDALNTPFKNALVTLASNIAPAAIDNEFELVEKIKRKLVRCKSEKEAADFSELFRKLQSQQVLNDRWSILYLLYSLANFSQPSHKKYSKFQVLGDHLSSTPLVQSEPFTVPSVSINASRNKEVVGGFMMGRNPQNVSSNGPFALSQLKTMALLGVDASGDKKSALRVINSSMKEISSIRPNIQVLDGASKSFLSFSTDFPESVFLRDVIYVMQGIEGKHLKYDVDKEVYRIESKVEISKSASKFISRLCECGFLHNKIKRYVDKKAGERTHGLVAQSFCSSLHQELTEYYRLISNLEAQMQQEDDLGISTQPSNSLTMRRMMVWLTEPIQRLTILASLTDMCQGKKGGELASLIHSFVRHGDPTVQSFINHVLSIVAQPIFSFVMRWIYDGELVDPHHEFFVASDLSVQDDRLWHDKYSLRKHMVPSFINADQARKILLTGKTISFLRQVCADRTLIKERDVVKATDTSKVETIFSQGQDASFSKMIDVVYKETSSYLLHVLYDRYKFMEHLKAMRRYLLLGQGDFIRHLMDLLEEDLAKPAQTLFLHNLTGILESAIRATNAQFDDPDILKRLDVRLSEVSPGDTGWVVFSLEYHISGHIRTVFTPESMTTYLKVFNFLWRAKRMEYILSVIWTEQMTCAKVLRPYPEFSSILHSCHLIGSEMLHFVQQIQYYINFEVLECSWVELMAKVEEADDLDQVISAHQEFLSTITSRSLLDSQSVAIVTQLRTIFDLVIQFQELQNTIHTKMMTEVDSIKEFQNLKKTRSQKGDWGTDEKMEKNEKKRREDFIQGFIPTTLSELRKLGQSYKKMVEQFLSLVTTFSDVSLRCLIFRLNFSEYYHHSHTHSGRTSSIIMPPSMVQMKKKAK